MVQRSSEHKLSSSFLLYVIEDVVRLEFHVHYGVLCPNLGQLQCCAMMKIFSVSYRNADDICDTHRFQISCIVSFQSTIICWIKLILLLSIWCICYLFPKTVRTFSDVISYIVHEPCIRTDATCECLCASSFLRSHVKDIMIFYNLQGIFYFIIYLESFTPETWSLMIFQHFLIIRWSMLASVCR